jgi:prepilin-type N-terminal cleavage/methylation domain-containing protein
VNRKRRSAFTLVEILATLAIIAILVGLLYLGAKHIGQSARDRSTQVTLKTLEGLLADYEASGGRMEILTDQYNGQGNLEVMPAGGVSDDLAYSNAALQPAIKRTQNVMFQLMTLPGNKSIITKLAPEAFLKDPATKLPMSPPILLDAWNSPILFAPGRTSTSPGNNQWGVSRMVNSTAQAPQFFQPPNGKGVFVSAGPDGDFSKGDDNLYSFEK